MVECSTLDWRTWSILSSQAAGGAGSFGLGVGSVLGFDFCVVEGVEAVWEPTVGAVATAVVVWPAPGLFGGGVGVATGSLRTR